MEIDKPLIEQMLAVLTKERDTALEFTQDYYKMRTDTNRSEGDRMGMFLQERLFQGRYGALAKVVNDLRHILELPPEGEDSNAYGYVFEVE